MNSANWAAWLALAGLFCAFTYNPIYQMGLFLVLCAVAVSRRQPLKAYLKLGLMMSAIPLIVNVLLVHLGKTVIFAIPRTAVVVGLKIPFLMFAGPVTAESAAFALIMVFFIANMLMAFQVFSGSASPGAILHLIPPQLSSVGLAVSIALRFIPSVVRDHGSITDVQASRGVRVRTGALDRRLSNQVKILSPTIITSLEKAFNLAESMASRGYGGRRTRYKVEIWNVKERLFQAAFAAALALTAYAKYAGAYEFWPYDSMAATFSFAAIAPLAALTIPAFMANESN